MFKCQFGKCPDLPAVLGHSARGVESGNKNNRGTPLCPGSVYSVGLSLAFLRWRVVRGEKCAATAYPLPRVHKTTAV